MARAANTVAAQVEAGLRQTGTGQAQNDSSGSKSNRATLLGDEAMLTLWQRMIEMYGHRWTSAYGEATAPRRGRDGSETEQPTPTLNTWRSALAGITWDEVKAGLRRCADAGEDWPPSAPRFRRRCRPPRPNYARDDLQDCVLYQRRRDNALEQKPAKRETSARHIAQLRGQLGRGGGAA